MPRKPNYAFERKERERIKSMKKAKRLAEKQDAREQKSGESDSPEENSGDGPVSPTAE